MANIEQSQQMIPFITCEILLCQDVCELVLGVNIFDLNLGVQIDSIEQPIKSNSVGSGNVSHCRISAFNDHLDHSFIVLKHTIKLLDARIGHLKEQHQCLLSHRFSCEACDVCEHH